MPKLINSENSVVMEINLVKNEYFDVEIGREDDLNWIPFTFDFIVEDKEVYSYTEERDVSFSIEDIKFMTTRFESVIKDKSQGIEIKRIGWAPMDMYFCIELDETYEENKIGVEIWIRMPQITEGKSLGYDRLFEFSVTTDSLKSFIEGLKGQLTSLCG